MDKSEFYVRLETALASFDFSPTVTAVKMMQSSRRVPAFIGANISGTQMSMDFEAQFQAMRDLCVSLAFNFTMGQPTVACVLDADSLTANDKIAFRDVPSTLCAENGFGGRVTMNRLAAFLAFCCSCFLNRVTLRISLTPYRVNAATETVERYLLFDLGLLTWPAGKSFLTGSRGSTICGLSSRANSVNVCLKTHSADVRLTPPHNSVLSGWFSPTRQNVLRKWKTLC